MTTSISSDAPNKTMDRQTEKASHAEDFVLKKEKNRDNKKKVLVSLEARTTERPTKQCIDYTKCS